MKFFSLKGLVLLLNYSLLIAQNPIIIDHTCIDLSEIPIEWINTAKDSLHIGYGHTSHGNQITSGMNAVESFYSDGSYDWSHEGGENELHLFEGDGYGDGYLDHDIGYTGWDDETREYLNAFPSCNVIIWAWCGEVTLVDLPTHLFGPMKQLETEYPNVQFVYMTGHLEGTGLSGNLFAANQQIREYCIANNKILFDFADIEKYDPDTLVNYQDFFANDECNYDPDGEEPIDRTENWANNWLNNNPSHELTQISGLCTSCAHSVSLNCTKKGIAAWYLWARLAGWNENSGDIPVTSITISGESGATTISAPGGTLQLYAEVLPEDATNPTVLWSVENGTGQASISSDGLVTAISTGTVTATASATDGSGVSGDFEITISNQEIQVEDINITSEGGATIISSPGGTLQLYAEVLPVDATNPTVLWSVENGTGQASISSDGLVTAISTGTVTATASATDGSGVSGNFEITISDQVVLVTEIYIISEDGSTTITSPHGILQLVAVVLPEEAENPAVFWSVENGTGQASVSSGGLVTAIADGTIIIIASATDGSGVSDNFEITVTGQNPSSVNEPSPAIHYSIIDRTLYFDNTSDRVSQVRISDLGGKLITIENTRPEENAIRFNRLQRGLYLLQFVSENSRIQNELLFIP